MFGKEFSKLILHVYICKYLFYVVRYVRILFCRVLSASYQYFIFQRALQQALQRVLQQRAKTLLKRLEFVPNGYIGFQAYKRTSPRVLNHPRTYCFILKLLLYNLYSICSFKHSFVSQSAQIVVIFLRAQQVSLRELNQIYIYSRREFICAVIFILHYIQGLDS